MGDEIGQQRFQKADFQAFQRHLDQEMECLWGYFSTGAFCDRGDMIGLELEACLVDREAHPAPDNPAFLAEINHEKVVAELAQFNFELNVDPQPAAGEGLARIAAELEQTWQRCVEHARALELDAVIIGILPTFTNELLCLKHLSPLKRYAALNEQVLRLRKGNPVKLDIQGERCHLREFHQDVMLEAAATSLQVHMQVPLAQSVRYYNAGILASAATVGISTNAPFLFGNALWDETRIPVFEQAVDTGDTAKRVSFGSGYAVNSLMEPFEENYRDYPVLLPVDLERPTEQLAHLRLHNGTIWRWNRALIGFDTQHQPHLRLEHRVMAAGPTLEDVMANVTFAVGLIQALAQLPGPLEGLIDFAVARENFYQAARFGLRSTLRLANGQGIPLWRWIVEHGVELARSGLQQLTVSPQLIDRYLNTIHERARTQRTGAAWQREYVEKHGADFPALVRAYLERQTSNQPVHTWTV